MLEGIYKKIPLDTDILLSHGPPYNIGDLCYDQDRPGSKSLARRIEELP